MPRIDSSSGEREHEIHPHHPFRSFVDLVAHPGGQLQLVMLQDKYIGLILAMSSSVFIGLSFIITKKGLMNAKRRHGNDRFGGRMTEATPRNNLDA